MPMAAKLAGWLRLLADWLDPVQSPDGELLARARRLVTLAEARFGGGYGEAKRRDVFAQLMKEFPSATKRLISQVIEDAL